MFVHGGRARTCVVLPGVNVLVLVISPKNFLGWREL